MMQRNQHNKREHTAPAAPDSQQVARRCGHRDAVELAMSNLTDQEMRSLLVDIISDGFNRSLNALEEAGAINTRELRSAYSGIGSKYYDLVTEQIDYSAQFGAARINSLLTDRAPDEGS